MKKILLIAFTAIFAIGFTACQSSETTQSSMNQNNSAMETNQNSVAEDLTSMKNRKGAMKESSPDAANAPYDLQFLDTMTHHHQGAIDMAETAVKKTQNQELKAFAQKIIADQTREIAQMKDWREKWYAGKPMAMNMEMPGMGDGMKMMMGEGMKKFEAATGKEFDLMFLDMMTPHHAGASVMAKEALTKAEHPEIKTLANQIIKAQESEIKMMNDWKAKWSK